LSHCQRRQADHHKYWFEDGCFESAHR
jgi:hypothetical protein